MKSIIAVKGTRNVGKTTAIKSALESFLKQYPEASMEPIETGADVIVAVTITVDKDGVHVTIIVIFASSGDTEEILQELMKKISGKNWAILVCATKTSGKTFDIINECESSTCSVTWVKKARAASEDSQKAENEQASRDILAHIERSLTQRVALGLYDPAWSSPDNANIPSATEGRA